MWCCYRDLIRYWRQRGFPISSAFNRVISVPEILCLVRQMMSDWFLVLRRCPVMKILMQFKYGNLDLGEPE